jgi:hypothetical protein
MEVELTDHVGYEPHQEPPGGAGNQRNGTSPKTHQRARDGGDRLPLSEGWDGLESMLDGLEEAGAIAETQRG